MNYEVSLSQKLYAKRNWLLNKYERKKAEVNRMFDDLKLLNQMIYQLERKKQ